MAYLASYLARGKFLPVSYVATMLKRFKFTQNCYLKHKRLIFLLFLTV